MKIFQETHQRLARLIDRLVMWFWGFSHPCRIGYKKYDHDLEAHQDEDGDGIYTMTYSWLQCSRCGATHNEDAEIPECPEDYFDDEWDGPWPT